VAPNVCTLPVTDIYFLLTDSAAASLLGMAQHAADEHQRKHKADLAARSESIERDA
jgi:hypothetical protein